MEAHNGVDWSTQAEMDYNGLGQRLSMDAAGVIAHYVLDGDRPLTAETGGNTNFYLYGLGAIGEKTTAWNYSLPDGTNTPRQLSDSSGEITLSARYTPWGDTLDTYGSGNFTYGYFGGVIDAATGLLYVGNGQYYDPATGRFLTRGVNPNSTNPYVPWNPIGAIVGPLGLIALVFGRRKKGSKAAQFLVLVLVVGSVGMTLAACGSEPTEVTAVITPDGTATITFGPTTVVTTVAAATEAANIDVTEIPCLTPLENVPAPTQTPTPVGNGGSDKYIISTITQPNGLTEPGVKAFNGLMTLVSLTNSWWNADEKLTVDETLAMLLFREASIAIGYSCDANGNCPYSLQKPVMTAVTAKWQQFCSEGWYTSICFNGFWAYYQAITDIPMKSSLQQQYLDNNLYNLSAYGDVYIREAKNMLSSSTIVITNFTPIGWATVPATGTVAKAIARNKVTYKHEYVENGKSWIFFVVSNEEQNNICKDLNRSDGCNLSNIDK